MANVMEQNKRTCERCGIAKPFNEFSRFNRYKIGYKPVCKQCVNEYSRTHYQDDSEKRKRVNQRYNTTPLGIYNKLCTNATKRGTEFNIDQLEFTIWWEAQEMICHYCGIPLTTRGHKPNKYSFDRKDNNLGYTLDNLALCCYSCNTVKSNVFTEEQMLQIAGLYLGGSNDELLIKDPNQNLPDKLMIPFYLDPEFAMPSKAGQSVAKTAKMAYSQSQEDMLKENWVKALLKEEK